jgi:hypothetical protein
MQHLPLPVPHHHAHDHADEDEEAPGEGLQLVPAAPVPAPAATGCHGCGDSDCAEEGADIEAGRSSCGAHAYSQVPQPKAGTGGCGAQAREDCSHAGPAAPVKPPAAPRPFEFLRGHDHGSHSHGESGCHSEQDHGGCGASPAPKLQSANCGSGCDTDCATKCATKSSSGGHGAGQVPGVGSPAECCAAAPAGLVDVKVAVPAEKGSTELPTPADERPKVNMFASQAGKHGLLCDNCLMQTVHRLCVHL